MLIKKNIKTIEQLCVDIASKLLFASCFYIFICSMMHSEKRKKIGQLECDGGPMLVKNNMRKRQHKHD